MTLFPDDSPAKSAVTSAPDGTGEPHLAAGGQIKRQSPDRPPITICVLTFGDYPQLAERALDSIQRHCDRSQYVLVVGANSVCKKTLALLDTRHNAGEIDRLIVSSTNLGKAPMMRRMFAEIDTEYIWWFDDDSYIIERRALSRWLHAAKMSPASTVLWGQAAFCEHPKGFTELADVVTFVRRASWYRGLPPPSWRPGGKGEFNFHGLGLGNGQWLFVVGGCFMIRTAAVRAMDWPDPRLFVRGDDVFLGEAVRQQGWIFDNICSSGIAINTEASRGVRI